MNTTTEKKFETILIEEGASCALLEAVEAHRLGRLARCIRAELGLGTVRRPQADLRRSAQVLAAARAADAAEWAAKMKDLKAHFAR
jgi:hypothetical protein